MATNIYKQYYKINKSHRESQKKQKALCIWFTGLSGSGKSTLANDLEQRLFSSGKHVYVLDGDNLRLGLSSDLAFSEIDRSENIRRVAEVAKLMVDAGLIVVVTLISPFKKDREIAKGMFKPDDFLEVYLSTPLSVCENRDSKGLYQKARAGEIDNFTGISSRYEVPETPDLVINTDLTDNNASVDLILSRIIQT
jgi:adenylyl-sulfate kinase